MADRDRNLDEDVAPGVELAEKAATWERKVGEPPERRRPPTPEVADEDLVVERKDLGPDSSTFIAAGSPIPPELRELPRRATREAPRKK
jgi:hypothetical protein